MQNCPKRFSVATRSPFGNTVTSVWLVFSDWTVAYCKMGRSGSGFDSGGRGVTTSVDGIFTVLASAMLARPLFVRWSDGVLVEQYLNWLIQLEMTNQFPDKMSIEKRNTKSYLGYVIALRLDKNSNLCRFWYKARDIRLNRRAILSGFFGTCANNLNV